MPFYAPLVAHRTGFAWPWSVRTKRGQSSESVELDAIAISSTHQEERADGPVENYRATRSATATRTDTPIEDIPQAISVVPKEVLDDLGSSRMERSLDFAGGVTRGNNFGGLQISSYNLRGFNTGEIYRNGFSINRGFISPPDASNLERVEVLKGPASGLFGRGDPGGLVNMVTKRPQLEAFNQLKVSVGRWDKYRTALDINRPLTDDGSLLARVNLAVEDNGSFRDHIENQRQVISPNLLWQINENSSLFIDTEFSRTDVVFDRGVPAVNGKTGAVNIKNFLGEPNDGKIRTDSQMLHISFEHFLNEQWKLRLAGQYLHGDLDGAATEPSNALSSAGILNRYWRLRDGFNAQDIATHAELIGNFELAGWHNQLLAGVEYENYHNRYHIRYSDPTNTYPINIYNPIYGQPKPALTGRQSYDRDYTENYALNLADQIEFNEKWHGLFGFRIEQFEQTIRGTNTPPVGSANPITYSKRTQKKDVVVPRAGVVYKWTPEVSVFASVGSSFKPNGSDGDSGMLKPEKGLGYESGLKLDLLDSRLGATLAAFYIEKENVRMTDPADINKFIAAGKVRSQGFDAQLAGQLTDNLRVIGAYAFIDTKVLKGIPAQKGAKLDNTPQHNASLMTVYQFEEGSNIGAAVNHVGKRNAATQRTGSLKLPSYTTMDLLGRWQAADNLNLGVNLNNLFNRKYYERSFGNTWHLPGEPRNLNISATLNF